MIGSKKRIEQLWGREFDIVKEGLSQPQVVAFITELINTNETLAKKAEQLTFLEKLAEKTVAEADKLAVSIKNKAQEETTTILQMAEEEASEIRTKAREEIKQLLVISRERLESKLKQKADEVYRKVLSRVEGTIAEVWSAKLVPEETSKEPTQHQASIPESVEEMEEPTVEEPSPVFYEGKVDLGISPPVDLTQFMKLRKKLQRIPQLKILQITSSQKKGSTISILLTEPIPLLDVLNGVPEVEKAVADTRVGATIAPESQQIESVERISIKLGQTEQT